MSEIQKLYDTFLLGVRARPEPEMSLEQFREVVESFRLFELEGEKVAELFRVIGEGSERVNKDDLLILLDEVWKKLLKDCERPAPQHLAQALGNLKMLCEQLRTPQQRLTYPVLAHYLSTRSLTQKLLTLHVLHGLTRGKTPLAVGDLAAATSQVEKRLLFDEESEGGTPRSLELPGPRAQGRPPTAADVFAGIELDAELGAKLESRMAKLAEEWAEREARAEAQATPARQRCADLEKALKSQQEELWRCVAACSAKETELADALAAFKRLGEEVAALNESLGRERGRSEEQRQALERELQQRQCALQRLEGESARWQQRVKLSDEMHADIATRLAQRAEAELNGQAQEGHGTCMDALRDQKICFAAIEEQLREQLRCTAAELQSKSTALAALEEHLRLSALPVLEDGSKHALSALNDTLTRSFQVPAAPPLTERSEHPVAHPSITDAFDGAGEASAASRTDTLPLSADTGSPTRFCILRQDRKDAFSPAPRRADAELLTLEVPRAAQGEWAMTRNYLFAPRAEPRVCFSPGLTLPSAPAPFAEEGESPRGFVAEPADDSFRFETLDFVGGGQRAVAPAVAARVAALDDFAALESNPFAKCAHPWEEEEEREPEAFSLGERGAPSPRPPSAADSILSLESQQSLPLSETLFGLHRSVAWRGATGELPSFIPAQAKDDLFFSARAPAAAVPEAMTRSLLVGPATARAEARRPAAGRLGPTQRERIGDILHAAPAGGGAPAYSYDHLEVAASLKLVSLIERVQPVSHPETWFSDVVFRTNALKEHKKKYVIITQKGLVLVTPKRVFGLGEIKRVIPFRAIDNVIVSTTNNYFVIRVTKSLKARREKEHDEILESYRRDELLLYLKQRCAEGGVHLRVQRQAKFVAMNSALEAALYDFSAIKSDKPHLIPAFQWASKRGRLGYFYIAQRNFIGRSEERELVVLLGDVGMVLFTKMELNLVDFVPLFGAQVVDLADDAKRLAVVLPDQSRKVLRFNSEIDCHHWKEALRGCAARL